jgi:uncharacterized protein YegP (UPF0339 family)
MQFVITKNNGGHFHWTLVGDDGAKVAVSAAEFDTQEAAHRAASDVHRLAGSAGGTET